MDPTHPVEQESQRRMDAARNESFRRGILRLELYVLVIFAALAWNACQVSKMEKRLDALSTPVGATAPPR